MSLAFWLGVIVGGSLGVFAFALAHAASEAYRSPEDSE